jgi:hypothetical protein
MDIKLDFVPPWLINFISRQLIGSGHKLYQKVSGWQQFAHLSYILYIDFFELQWGWGGGGGNW